MPQDDFYKVMCGIAGVINGSRQQLEKVRSMCDLITHRGPDGDGYFIDEEVGVALGSRRLKILDLSEKAKMPMASADGSVLIIQNGEIYNYLEIKKELLALGYFFRSTGDTEVILNGYRQWGAEIFPKLRGMFALAVFDRRAKKTYLVRDRVGIKPLYYLKSEPTIYFASEVKALRALDQNVFNRTLDLEKVKLLLGFMFLPQSDSTLFTQVKKILPGHYLQVSPEGVEDVTYWQLRETRPLYEGTFERAVDDLDVLLTETVRQHLASDVPLGVMLSGGLDSSLITVLVKKHSGSETLTFTARFNHRFNESEKALKVAQHLSTKHAEVFIEPKEINDGIEDMADDLDDLTTFDGGLITTKILCRKIKEQGVTVLLLGEGADEIFGGYSWFGLSQLPFSFLPSALRSWAYYYAISRNLTFDPGYYYGFWNKLLKEFKNDDVFRTISNAELLLQLPNHLLMKVDKGSMAASIEARVPYLDHKVVEFVYSLPREYKLKGDWFNLGALNEKYVLREVAKRYLPAELLVYKKRGFMLPLKEVLESNLNKVKDYALAEGSVTRKIMPFNKIENLFKKSSLPLINMEREYLLWRIFLLEVWRRSYQH